MSTCISREGEYSDHEPGDWCPRCGAFNEEAIIAERENLRAALAAFKPEYAPGFIAADGRARRSHVGTIEPTYLDQFVAEGGEVICRDVGPWRTYTPSPSSPTEPEQDRR